jgi:hypothetical protein
MLFFSSYEYSKRHLVNVGVHDFMAYLIAGLVGDLFASAIYVPSEVGSVRRPRLTVAGCKGEITTSRIVQ